MPTTTVSKSQFKANALEYSRQIEATGQPFVFTDYVQPTIEVRPFRATEISPLEALEGAVLRFDRPTDPVGDDDWETAN